MTTPPSEEQEHQPGTSVPLVREGGVPAGPGLELRVFGPLVARRDDVELSLGGPKEQAVLAKINSSGAAIVCW